MVDPYSYNSLLDVEIEKVLMYLGKFILMPKKNVVGKKFYWNNKIVSSRHDFIILHWSCVLKA